ncbi:MAG: carbon starvation protein A [Succinivibrionaceae bacterium]|nr:carbon starvation protein A [Succinivibrionaceae bacterium]
MPRYLWFIIAALGLVLGYMIYGKFVEKVFGPRPEKKTPAITQADGIDYVSMSKWKVWLIQLLNIAGVGPVFGPILGALYGPSALLWIVLGSIFAGAVHDYMSGMLSVRYKGANIPDVVGYNLGSLARKGMCVFAVILLLLVGTTFATAPAGLMVKLTTGTSVDIGFGAWLGVIFLYYFIATLVPIDKLIGRIYPFFGALLLVMAAGVTIAMFVEMPEQFYGWAEWGVNQHPKELPLWPLMFITIACGALSGFHSTQSPLMARCIANESEGRMVFYGAMIAEGFIGLVWATVGMTFYPSVADFAAAGAPANVVYDSSVALLGAFGGVLAILGVIVLPVTSGDTAFRACRLTLAEIIKFDQHKIPNRLYIALPLFGIGILLSQLDFGIIWRYFGWANQTLAGIVLWSGACYLARREKCHWICTIPATFITAASIDYIVWEPNLGFGISAEVGGMMVSHWCGIVVAAACFAWFLVAGKKEVAGAPALNEV